MLKKHLELSTLWQFNKTEQQPNKAVANNQKSTNNNGDAMTLWDGWLKYRNMTNAVAKF